MAKKDNNSSNLKWYERGDYQGWIIFGLMFMGRCLFTFKDYDINKVLPWDFLMGMFFMLALIGDK